MAEPNSKLRVELLASTPDPERTIIRATRTCYQSFEKQNDASDEKLLAHLIKNNETIHRNHPGLYNYYDHQRNLGRSQNGRRISDRSITSIT
jgi:arsenate reductase-like glutaredoxin family protein